MIYANLLSIFLVIAKIHIYETSGTNSWLDFILKIVPTILLNILITGIFNFLR